MSYEEEDRCISHEEEDTCMSYEEEDTCLKMKTSVLGGRGCCPPVYIH